MPTDLGTWQAIRRELTVFEDEACFVIDKPPGLSLVGERHGIDLVRMGRDAGEWAMAVHRIDKVTSGAVLFAKSAVAHAFLTQQFRERTVHKLYLTVTRSASSPMEGSIDLPLTVGRKGRVRVAALREHIRYEEKSQRWFVRDECLLNTRQLYPSLTRFRVVWSDGLRTLLLVSPLTGRRQQIRVHLAWTGHPILGDPLFEANAQTRTALHAWQLTFRAVGSTPQLVTAKAEPGPDFWDTLGPDAPDLSVLLRQARESALAFEVEPRGPVLDGADDW